MRYYLDTEYDGHNGPLISVALISADKSKDIYIICKRYAKDPWVVDKVIPVLYNHDSSKCVETLTDSVGVFLRDFLLFDDDITIISDSMTDIGYFTKAYSTDGDGNYKENPKKKMIFIVENIESFPTEVEGAVPHNAWWDALVLLTKLESQNNILDIVKSGSD